MNVVNQHVAGNFALYNGDSTEVLKNLPDSSADYEIYSPPFASLYTYSNSERDLGNCRSSDEFFTHFEFIAKELFRVLKAGRLMSVHCMDIPLMKERDGFIGLSDFPGDLIRLFQKIGFIYHSRIAIWKDPLIEATRTKSIGLMHKQIQKDSAMCRQGLPDYVITMRKPGENAEPVAHPNGIENFHGEDEPNISKNDITYSHHVWRKYASPIWMDINQSNTLNKAEAREEKDEKHICPLQLDVIARCLELYTNKNDVVLTPFLGIGSEIYQAIKMGRRGIGIELKKSYYDLAVENCESAEVFNRSNLFNKG